MARTVNTELDIVQQVSTTVPAAGKLRVYGKTDGKLYVMKPDGSEIAVGAGGNSKTFAYFAG